MGHNGCDGSQASGPWAIGSGYRFNGAEHFTTVYLSLYCFGRLRHRDARAAEIADCADYILAFGSQRIFFLFNLFNVKRSLHAIFYFVCVNT